MLCNAVIQDRQKPNKAPAEMKAGSPNVVTLAIRPATEETLMMHPPPPGRPAPMLPCGRNAQATELVNCQQQDVSEAPKHCTEARHARTDGKAGAQAGRSTGRRVAAQSLGVLAWHPGAAQHSSSWRGTAWQACCLRQRDEAVC